MLKITNTGMKVIIPTIFGRIRKLAELTPMISIASICSVTRMVPISEAMLLPTLPARISDMMEEENSSRIISRVVYPIVNLGMSGELIFSEIWMAITVPIKMEMMTTIQRESTPNLYISFINCLKNMLHRLGTEMHFPINMTYSPT